VYSFAAMSESMTDRPVLVAPAAFDGLRAPAVAAAIGRGLEAAGLAPPDLCPLAGGGAGTIEVLLPALGGETGAGFALVGDGATALVECASDPAGTAAWLCAAGAEGPAVILLAAADAGLDHAASALHAAGGLGGARIVALRGPVSGHADVPAGVAVQSGARFVLDALAIDPRLRMARAVIVGTGRLDGGALRGGVAGELAVRARQAGVPCHAVVGLNALDRFEARMLDLQRIVEAPTVPALEAAAARLVDVLR
jgi:glycerate 2-kinase